MPVPRTILEYQQRCHREYGHGVGLPEPYTYPDGNPIRPLPPVQTTPGGLMLVGAYPSARFEKRRSTRTGLYRQVPIADNLQPFGYEQYFDGVSVRTLESGDGLREYVLDPLGVAFESCWITDLVKVFLYKPDHVDSCGDVLPNFPVPELRSRFLELGTKSLPWLKEECDLCRPRLVLTFGEEVAQVVSGDTRAKADDLLARPVQHPVALGGTAALYLPHPDACRRMDKWRDRLVERLAAAREFLQSDDGPQRESDAFPPSSTGVRTST